MGVLGVALIVMLIVFVLLGLPISFSIGVSSIVVLLIGDMPLQLIPTKVYAGLNSFTFLAIPFFMLAGSLMNAGGLNKRILRVTTALIGWISGSLAMVTVVASAFFASLTGSGVATASAIGGITIPSMKEEGYPAPFAAAVTAAAAVLGPIIPPSIPLIVYGSAMSMSISDLFKGSLFPGLICTVALMILVYFLSKKNNYAKHARQTKAQIWAALKDGIWALMMPIIVLGGIFSGLFTPTEAAVVAVFYVTMIGFLVYKELTFKSLFEMLFKTGVTAGMMMFAMGNGQISGWIFAVSKLPQAAGNFIQSITSSQLGFLLLANVFLLITGMFLEANSSVILLTPVLVPIAQMYGVSTLQFGVMMVFNLCVGMLTPPVAATLLIGNQIAGERLDKTVRAVIPFLLVEVAVLALITIFPQIILWLPNAMRG